jgi:hypothetical protein
MTDPPSIKKLQQERIEAMGHPERLTFTDIRVDRFEDSLLRGMASTYWMDERDEAFNNGAIDLQDGTTMDDGPENRTRDEGFYNDGAKAMLDMLDTYRVLQQNLEQESTQESILKRIHRIIGSQHHVELAHQSYQDMMVTTFIRKKRLDNAVCATVICSAEEELEIRNSLQLGRNKALRENGLLSVHDALCSQDSSWPVLTLYLPDCSYLYWTEEERENDDWCRMVYGIEVQILGPQFREWRKEESSKVGAGARNLCIEATTNEFLSLSPYHLGNLELMIALCRILSKTGTEGDFLNISKVRDIVERRQQLYSEEGIVLKFDIHMRIEKIDMWVSTLKQIIRESAPDYDGLLNLELQQ